MNWRISCARSQQNYTEDIAKILFGLLDEHTCNKLEMQYAYALIVKGEAVISGCQKNGTIEL